MVVLVDSQSLRLVTVKSLTRPINMGETTVAANGLHLIIPAAVVYRDSSTPSDGEQRDSKSRDLNVEDVPSGLTTVVS